MEPSRPWSTPLLDRARRNPVIRPAYRQIFAAKAWSPPKPANSAPNANAANEPAGRAVEDSGEHISAPALESTAIPVPDLTRTTAPVLVLVLAGAIAIGSGANLGSLAWGTLQALGLVAPPALEAAQREQAAAISQLDQNVNGLSAALAGLSAHVYSTDSREAETTRRIGEIDAVAVGHLGAVGYEMKEIARHDAAPKRVQAS